MITPANGSIASASPPRAASAAASSRRCRRRLGLGTFSPLPRQPRQQRARPEGLRGAVGAFRPAHAQPQRRCPHLHHRRLRHLRHLVAPQPPAARAADSRRAPQRHPGDRTGRRAEFRGDRLRDAPAGERAAERAAADPGFPPRARHDGGGRAIARREPHHPRQCRRHRDPDRRRADLGGVEGDLARGSAEPQRLRRFALLDEAIEWAEDQVIYRYGGFTVRRRKPPISASRRCWPDLAADEIAALAELSTARRYEAGQRIISAGEPANSLFFLQSGMVSVKLPSGVRLASLGPGMEFGEMAIIEQQRSADVWADTPVKCLELPLDTLCRLPPAPPADRDEDHAQSFGAAGAAADPRQRQGRPAQRVADHPRPR